MITRTEIYKIIRILSFAFAYKEYGSPQEYNPSNKGYKPNVLVAYPNTKQIKSIWLDVESINQVKLKRLFSRHKEVNLQFFINYLDGFYRVGWKV